MANVQFLRGTNDALQKILKKANGTLTTANYNEYMGLTGDNVLTSEQINAALNAIPAAQEGAFYLTEDTYRLYTGVMVPEKGEGNNAIAAHVELVELNQSIKFAKNLAALNTTLGDDEEEGQFAYLTDNNVFAVFNGTTWTQVNTDTYLLSNKFNLSKNEVDNTVTSVSLQSQIKDTRDGLNAAHTLSDTITFAVSGNLTMDYTYSGSENNPTDKTITFGYSTPAEADVTIYTQPNLTASNEIKDITLIAEQDGYEKGSVNLEAGNNVSFVGIDPTNTDMLSDTQEQDTDGHLLYWQQNGSKGTTQTNNPVYIPKELSDASYKINVDDMTTSGLSFNNKTRVDQESGETVPDNGFVLSLTDVKHSGNSAVKAGFDPKIRINSKTPVSFINGVATLDTYTSSEINDLIQTAAINLNSMTYMGTIDRASDIEGLRTNEASHIGDTYKIGTFFQIGNENFQPGDLIIIRCVNSDNVSIPEDIDSETGESYIAQEHFAYDHIKDAEDFVYSSNHSYDTTNKKANLQIQESLYGSSSTPTKMFDVEISADGELEVSSFQPTKTVNNETVPDNSKPYQVIISHTGPSNPYLNQGLDENTYLSNGTTNETNNPDGLTIPWIVNVENPATQSAGVGQEITCLTDVIVDEHGHIIEKDFKTTTLCDTINVISYTSTYSNQNTVSDGNRSLTITKRLDGTAQNGSIDIPIDLKSDTLTFGTGPVSTNYATINLQWGTF